jgi:hypothetical protein
MNIKNSKEQTTKADKGKTLVILTQEEYKHKISDCIHDNHFIKSDKPNTTIPKIGKTNTKIM